MHSAPEMLKAWVATYADIHRSSEGRAQMHEKNTAVAERLNPSGLYNSLKFGFSHAVRQRGSDTLHLAGQVALNKDGELVGPGDLAAQTRQVLANLRQVLEAAGATPANLVRLRTYVVNHSPDKLGPVLGEIMAFYAGVTPAANTFIGVSTLARPDYLIEIEATAAVG
jgi:enamine deaminase RidA (YjgF/YER057c/UK114 family)